MSSRCPLAQGCPTIQSEKRESLGAYHHTTSSIDHSAKPLRVKLSLEVQRLPVNSHRPALVPSQALLISKREAANCKQFSCPLCPLFIQRNPNPNSHGHGYAQF